MSILETFENPLLLMFHAAALSRSISTRISLSCFGPCRICSSCCFILLELAVRDPSPHPPRVVTPF